MNRLCEFKGRLGTSRPGGVGAVPSLFFGWLVPTPYLASEPKCSKYKQTKNNSNERKNMNKTKFNTETHMILKRVPLILAIVGITGQFVLTGCASVNQKDESIEAILAKENTLIEKVKLERGQPQIVEALSANENLQKAEVHLLLSLDEIIKANETITIKLLKQKPKEVLNGKGERLNN